MNKIVRDHYPVERLPEDLRSELEGQGWVRIEIVPETHPGALKSIAALVGTGANVHGTPEEVLEHIRSLREDR